MNDSKIAALYARVSTTDQSCEVQLDDLRRYASRRFTNYREYVDTGASGAQRHRPQLDAMLSDARRGMFDAVVVWKFDRLARSLKHLIDTLQELNSLHIDFLSFTENIDTTTPSGQLLFHIVGAMAEFEHALIVERVRAGFDHARRLGKRIGRPRVQIDVETIVRLRREGMSLRRIARKLDIPVSRVRRALALSTKEGTEQKLLPPAAPSADE